MANDDKELRERIQKRVEEEMRLREFTSFPVPHTPDDMPLVRHAGFDYTCTGCGTHIPDGVWIHETVKDGMVIGLRMVNGADGDVIHQCGEVS